VKQHLITPREARVALVAALLACAITMVFTAFFDPFGLQSERADNAARRATAYVLCSQTDTYNERLLQLSSRSDSDARDLTLVLEDGIRRSNAAQSILGIECPRTTPQEDNP